MPTHSVHLSAILHVAEDYNDFINVVKTLGNPDIWVMIPPPLMQKDSIGANQTVINSVYPQLIPLIVNDNEGVNGPIDVFSGMGGSPPWYEIGSPSDDGCSLDDDAGWQPCSWWCDEQSCDECHPNDTGYAHLAAVVKAGLGL